MAQFQRVGDTPRGVLVSNYRGTEAKVIDSDWEELPLIGHVVFNTATTIGIR